MNILKTEIIHKYGIYEDIKANLTNDFNTNNPMYSRYFNKECTITAFEYTTIDNFFIEEHFHDWIEFTLLVSGSQHIFIKNQEYILSEGDFIMIDYNCPHHSFFEKNTKKLTMQFKSGIIESIIPDFQSNLIFCNSSAIKNPYDRYTYQTLVELFCYMFRAFTKKPRDLEIDYFGYFFLFFYTLMKECSFKKEVLCKSKIKFYKIDYILSYINRHYKEDISLSSLSSSLHLSSQYISKVIKKELGIGFKEYLTKTRLMHANSLIKYSNKTLLAISEECGFKNVKSFIYYFKKEYRTLPYDYLKKTRKYKVKK